MTIETIEPISAAPIDYDLVERAGQPGTIGRVAVFHALEVISERPCYRNAGRGPYDYDWLGYIREVASRVCASMHDTPRDDFELGDAVGYPPSHGLPFEVACQLVEGWGLRPYDHRTERCKPGDIVIYDMPGAHGAVLISDTADQPQRTAWAASDGAMAIQAQVTFGRPAAIGWYGPDEYARPQRWFTWGEG